MHPIRIMASIYSLSFFFIYIVVCFWGVPGDTMSSRGNKEGQIWPRANIGGLDCRGVIDAGDSNNGAYAALEEISIIPSVQADLFALVLLPQIQTRL